MIYESVDGKPNRRVAFVTTDGVGRIISTTVSKDVIATDRTGYTFILDDYVTDQLTKYKIVNGALELLEGEELIIPVKTEKELQIEAIERQLAALKAELDEEVNNEEQTDAPLLNYTDQPTE